MQTHNVKQGTEADRLELLLFSLGGSQVFGINVLKVKEVMPSPSLTKLPDAHSAVLGVAQFRGHSVSVIDLGAALGRRSLSAAGQRLDEGQVIICEFNRTLSGFWVSDVDRIVILDWNDVHRPPKGSATSSYVTGVTRLDDRLIQILDVEKVLFETILEDREFNVSLEEEVPADMKRFHILVADDSAIARKQTARTLDQMGVDYIMTRDGREALELLEEWSADNVSVSEQVSMIISDIEMPELDGYSLTRAIRANPKLSDLYILLHTSLTGVINAELAAEVGADATLTKFEADELARCVVEGLKARRARS